MSALRWPAYTSAEISECLRLALATSPLAQPPEANWRCRVVEREEPSVTSPVDDRHEHRGVAPQA
jgi:hypothetical protein